MVKLRTTPAVETNIPGGNMDRDARGIRNLISPSEETQRRKGKSQRIPARLVQMRSHADVESYRGEIYWALAWP